MILRIIWVLSYHEANLFFFFVSLEANFTVAIKPSFFFIAAAIINEAEGTILKAKTTQRPPILDMNSGEAHADRFGLA